MKRDFLHGLRLLAKNPGLTAAVVLTLALTLGANTTVFSVVHGVLLRALPYPEAERIVDAGLWLPPAEGRPGRKELLDGRRFLAWQEGARTVETLAAWRARGLTLAGPDGAERLPGAEATAELFPLLGVAAARGRGFAAGEERVVVLGHGLWQRRFQGDPGIVGKPVTLDGAPHTVVGVMPEGFFFPDREVQLWTPLAVEAPAPTADAIDTRYYPVVARLKAGVSPRQAAAEADGIFHGLGTGGGEAGELAAGTVRLVPLRDEMVAGARPALLATLAAAGLVLLLACINLAGLLLARSRGREGEMAVRSALGGSRGRLVRQGLTESVTLALAGGAAGLLLAAWIHRLLPRLLPGGLPRLEDVHLDTRVLLFSAALAGLTGLAFGLLPAWRSSRANLARPLHGGSGRVSARLSSQNLFVVAQVALAFVLLVGAGLLLRSFLELVAIEPGYEPDGTVTATFDLAAAYPGAPARGTAFVDELLDRLARHPEVEAAGVVSFPPLTPGLALSSCAVVGQPAARTLAVPQSTSPGYLRAMGLRLAAGRWLTERDHAGRAAVAMVNRTFVDRYIEGAAVGKHLEMGAATLEIVGVVEDARLLGPAAPTKAEVFTSYHQAEAISGTGPGRLTLAVRSTGDPAALAPFLRRLVRDLDPALALEDVATMNGRLAAGVAGPRFYALLLGLFAGMALVLAAAGVYGVLSQAVARQTRALGIRRALGAGRPGLLARVLGHGLLLVSTGLAIGAATAAGATRLLSRFLFGVTATDPLTYVLAAAALLAATLLACYLPARRATRVDPMVALREP